MYNNDIVIIGAIGAIIIAGFLYKVQVAKSYSCCTKYIQLTFAIE